MTSGTVKYLFVIDSLAAGGAERSLLDVLPRLADGGAELVLVALKGSTIGFEEEARQRGYDLRVFPPLGRLGRIRSLRRVVRSEAPDLVYTCLFEADIAGRVACARLAVPVMSALVNTSYHPARLADPAVPRWKLEMARWLDGLTARWLTDHFHAISNAAMEQAVSDLGLSPERITVVRRGRDPNRLRPGTAEERRTTRSGMGLDQEAPVLITVGRHEYQKGHLVLIDAFAEVASRYPAATLLVAGREGNTSEDLRRRIRERELVDRVRLLGHRADIPELLGASDLFVFPSLFEGLGGALIEALASGLPVVASDIPAVREVVGGDGSSALVPPGDPAALAAEITSLLSDRERMRRMSIGGRRRFEDRFTSDRLHEELAQLLHRVATAPLRRPLARGVRSAGTPGT